MESLPRRFPSLLTQNLSLMVEYFSGMGNSAAVAAELRELLGNDFEDIVWVCPVYSWGLPPVVVKHIRNQDMSGRRVHLVCTCGDDTGMIDQQWSRLISEVGGVCGSVYSVRMPNTYVCLPFMDVDSEEVARKKLDDAEKRVKYIAERLNSGVIETDIVRGSIPGFKSKVIYPFFFKRLMRSSAFHHTDACVSCGKCIRSCPQQNIHPDSDGRPVWHDDCAYCLRCYHVCPNHAVAYGKHTSRKGQYLHPHFKA